MSEHLKIGRIGEDVACKFLKNKGYKILDRNYRLKFGEIDIISEYKNVLYFVEVKTTKTKLDKKGGLGENMFRPEERVDVGKMKRIGRAVRVYLQQKNIKSEWKFKVLVVFFDPERKMAKIRVIEDMIAE